MLRLFSGRAGAGKTGAVMEEIRAAVAEKKPGRILIVPEQYSHEAERELCRVCGNAMPLYAEVLSFSAMARKYLPAAGSSAPMLDKGGRLLCMALALDALAPRLKIYGAARRKPELQTLLLSEVDELKTACVSPEELMSAAAECGGGLGDKLKAAMEKKKAK